MQKVLVTGGAGFIGSHLCERLLREGNKVYCVDNLSTGAKDNIQHLGSHPQFEFLDFDITKPLPESLSADAVFHLASPASPNHHSRISYHALPMETMMANTEGTKYLLEFALKHNASFLFTSTSEVYGDPLVHPQSEEYRGNVSTTGPRSVYDEAKRFGETLVAYFVREKNLNARIARLFNTYGPHMSLDDKRMIVNFISQALSNEPITIFGDGRQTRSLCFVSDTVDGLMRLMFTPNLKGEVVNIGSDQEHTIYEYAELVKKLTNSQSEIRLAEELPQDDPLMRRPDISKAKKLLDWEPHISLEDGLREMIEYIKEKQSA